MNFAVLTKPWLSQEGAHGKPNKWLMVLAFSSAIVVYFLLIYGSHVRVTDSGMGCPDWPLCKGSISPFQGFHAFMEQTHRYIAALVSILVVATAFFASRLRTQVAAIKPALFTVGIVFVQIILGAITVFDSNGAPTVAAHLLAGLLLLAGATVTAVATVVDKKATENLRLNLLGWYAIGAAALLYLSGSLIVNAEAEKDCASFPLCPKSQPLHLAILHIIHRSIVLVAAIALLAFAIHAWKNWSHLPGARVLSVTLVSLIAATATLGIFSALLKAPANLQDLHLAGAAAVLATCVALASLGWVGAGDAKVL